MKRSLLTLLLLLASTAALPQVGQSVLKNTDGQSILYGPLVDSTDASPETGQATPLDTAANIQVCQDGTSCANRDEIDNPTHVGNGIYAVPLSENDTNAERNVCIWHAISGVLSRTTCVEVISNEFANLQNGDDEILTSLCAGAVLCDSLDGPPSSQTVFDVFNGPTNVDALIGAGILIRGAGGGMDIGTVCDYDQTNDRFTITSGAGTCAAPAALNFTIAANDEVYVYAFSSGAALRIAQALLDDFDSNGIAPRANSITETTIQDEALTAAKFHTDVTTELQTGLATAALLGTPADTDIATDIANLAGLLGIAEPASVPTFGSDAGEALSWLLALSRNEIRQTATTKTIRNDADDGNIATCAVSDDGTTFTRAECQ